MPHPPQTSKSDPRLSFLCLAVVLAGAGCGASGMVPDAESEAVLSQCSAPVEGSRYSLCGKLTTAGFGGPGAQRTLRGSVDSAPQPEGSRYSIRGGTFHVAR